MELLTAQVKLRPASYDDLAHWEEDIKITLTRQRFFVRMADDRLECYTLEQFSDKHQVKQLIDENRVYVFCGSSLVHDTDGKVISVEVVADVAA